MGLNLSRPTPSQPQPSQGQAPAAPQEEESYQQYDISADRQMMTQTLVNSPEVDALASQIEVYNLESIVSFGAGAADEISKCSDVVLNSMNLSQLDDSSAMLNTLAKIMDKFDIEEIKENPGLFGKLFGNLRSGTAPGVRAVATEDPALQPLRRSPQSRRCTMWGTPVLPNRGPGTRCMAAPLRIKGKA